MNLNNKFLKEAIEFDKKWGKIIEDFDVAPNRKTTASLMECQRLFNETGKWDCCDECHKKEEIDYQI